MLFLYWLDNIDTHNIKQHANNIGPIYACLLDCIAGMYVEMAKTFDASNADVTERKVRYV